MSVAIVIPARLASTRLPRKLLLDLGGKSVIQRTFEQARLSKRAAAVYVATDSPEIAEAARGFGAPIVMTRADHESGTERIAEAANRIDASVVVNVQGDEPEIDPASIDALIDTHMAARFFATTLACPFPDRLDPANPAAVKAVLGRSIAGAPHSFEALYFTRALAPYPREGDGEFHLHIGAYAYGRDALMRFAAAKPGRLERIEKLEQLRILEIGERIAVRVVKSAARGVDTPEDYAAARARFGV
jgi:3-deoxy-manno-octulosonate cytidylyltransferase (CMP-KDO synthetase)